MIFINHPNHPQGSAAYIGADKAVFAIPTIGNLYGNTAGLLWKSFETYSQFSFRNQCLVASDWCVRGLSFWGDAKGVLCSGCACCMPVLLAHVCVV